MEGVSDAEGQGQLRNHQPKQRELEVVTPRSITDFQDEGRDVTDDPKPSITGLSHSAEEEPGMNARKD